MADVFVSYASEDRDRIAPLIDAIESLGLSVWWDRRIGAGSSFDREIERELEAASCVVVVWSENSMASDWVRDEAQEGYDRGILIPVRIDDIKLPLGFRRSQTADLFGWPTSGDDLQTLLESIRNRVGASVIQPRRLETAFPVPESKTKLYLRRDIQTVFAVTLLIGTGWWYL